MPSPVLPAPKHTLPACPLNATHLHCQTVHDIRLGLNVGLDMDLLSATKRPVVPGQGGALDKVTENLRVGVEAGAGEAVLAGEAHCLRAGGHEVVLDGPLGCCMVL